MSGTHSRRWLVSALLAALATGFCLLFVGVYADREWGEWHLFWKYRPSPRVFFYAPLGESDGDVRQLSARDRQAERDYREFVERRGSDEGQPGERKHDV